MKKAKIVLINISLQNTLFLDYIIMAKSMIVHETRILSDLVKLVRFQ